MNEYIAKHGIPKRVRTDPGTVFKSKKFGQFCKENYISHVVCPIRDHRGNGKVERMIRTLNERLRTDREIVLTKKNVGLSRILFALRSEKGKDGKSAFERHTNREPNTPKKAMSNSCILDKDPNLQIMPSDFSPDVDSTIFMRERTRGSKLEGTFRKTNAKIVDETRHTITMLPESGKVIVSKRDVAIRRNNEAKSQKKKEKKYHKKRQSAQKWQLREHSTSDEISQPMGIANYSGTSESEDQRENLKADNQHSKIEEKEHRETEEGQQISESEKEDNAKEKETTAQIDDNNEEENEKEKTNEEKVDKRKTRSGRKTKKPDWLGINVMVTAVEKVE